MSNPNVVVDEDLLIGVLHDISDYGYCNEQTAMMVKDVICKDLYLKLVENTPGKWIIDFNLDAQIVTVCINDDEDLRIDVHVSIEGKHIDRVNIPSDNQYDYIRLGQVYYCYDFKHDMCLYPKKDNVVYLKHFQ